MAILNSVKRGLNFEVVSILVAIIFMIGVMGWVFWLIYAILSGLWRAGR